MNPVHLHLLVNHFPIIGTIFGIIVLLAGFLFKKDDLKNAGYGLFILTALLSIPTYLSGEPAEEAIENLSGTAEVFVEKHEEIASIAFWFVLALGAVSIATLVLTIKGNTVSKMLGVITLLLSLIVFGVMAKVGNTGGEIRHPEIRQNSTTNLQDTFNGGGNKNEEDNDED